MITDDLESIYQQAIAAVPRSAEKDNGFRELDLIKEMVKRMPDGTDREKRLKAASLIEHKTKASTIKQVFDMDRLVRWDEWLIETANMTLPWMEHRQRQSAEEMREAQAGYERETAEHAEMMELFDGLPDREKLSTLQACNIKYRQGNEVEHELARKRLRRFYSAGALLHDALMYAAVAAHPDFKQEPDGVCTMVGESPIGFDDLIDWFQRTHALKAREVHKAVVAELDAIRIIVIGIVTYQLRAMQKRPNLRAGH
jgi:hypothetical protein